MITIILDEGTGEQFNKRLKGPEILQDGGNLQLVSKEKATDGGKPAVLITFTVEQTDGQIKQVQTVCTMREFLSAASVFKTKYGHLIE